MGHGSYLKLKTALMAVKKGEPSFKISLKSIIKNCKVCTHHRDTEVIHFNSIVQVEIHENTDIDTSFILMTDLFSDFTLGIITIDTEPQTVINNFLHPCFRDNMATALDYKLHFQVQVNN